MARTAKTKDEIVETQNTEEVITISKKELDDMNNRTARLEAMLEELMLKNANTPSQQVAQPVVAYPQYAPTSKMDTPCTIIHLLECAPDLPTTLEVNGITHYFTSFGERKTFVWSDLSNIVSKYRSWFTRGVFALGEDCEQFKNELPSDIMTLSLPEHFYRKMSEIPVDEFKKNISGLTSGQKVQVAKTWINRYQAGMSGYRNIEKIKILNSETNGLLKEIITEITIEE